MPDPIRTEHADGAITLWAVGPGCSADRPYIRVHTDARIEIGGDYGVLSKLSGSMTDRVVAEVARQRGQVLVNEARLRRVLARHLADEHIDAVVAELTDPSV